MVNVYCVKWGTKYDRSFVENLKTSIKKHFTIEHKFNCLTDKPEKDYDIPVTHPELRGVWHKLSLFQYTGNNLFFDLDIKINSNINFLAEKFLNVFIINFSTTLNTSSCSTNDISKSN